MANANSIIQSVPRDDSIIRGNLESLHNHYADYVIEVAAGIQGLATIVHDGFSAGEPVDSDNLIHMLQSLKMMGSSLVAHAELQKFCAHETLEALGTMQGGQDNE